MKRIAIVLLVMFIACGKGDTDKTVRSTKVYTEADIVDGGSLIIGISSEPESLNPLTTLSKQGKNVISLIFRRLADINEDLDTFSPQMAKDWDFSADGMAITLHLRTDVYWHDGTKFTSQDVVFTFSLQTDPEIGWDGIDYKESIGIVEAPDDSTVVFIFKNRTPNMLMDAVEGYIVPQHLLGGNSAEEVKNSDFMRNPVGTGPFSFVEWKSQQSITLEKNPSYYIEDKPHLDRVIFQIVPDNLSLWNQVAAGDVDFMEGVPPREFARLNERWDKGESDIMPITYLGRLYDYIGWNLLDSENWSKVTGESEDLPDIDRLMKPNKFFGNRKVRAALTMALDRRAIATVVNSDLGIVMDGPIPPIIWAHNPDANVKWDYDPEKAKAWLAEEGWTDSDGDGILDKDGLAFSFTMGTNAGDERREHALTLVQEQLKQIGVDMKPLVADRSLLLGRMLGGREFDAVLIGWEVALKMDLVPLFHSSTFFIPFHFTGYYSEEFDTWSDSASVLFDRAEAQIYWDKIANLLSNDLPYTWLYYKMEASAINARFKGAEFDVRGGYINLEDWWVPLEERLDRDTWAGR